MEVKFRIETLGYITAELLFINKRVKIGHSSSYGDKFQELLNNFFFIYDIVKNNKIDYFPYSVDTLWQDDFINYLWEISINSPESLIEIKVYKLSTSSLEYKEELINEIIKMENLFNGIYLSLEEAFIDFGFVGYKKNWEVGNFPMYEYITLKAERERLELRNINELEQEWKQKINIIDELNVIKSCV